MYSYDYQSSTTGSSSHKQVSTYHNTTANLKNPSEHQISNLQKGQQIKATILDLTSNQATLKLSNSEVIHARVRSDVALSIGDKAVFQVEEANASTLSFKVISDGSNQTPDGLIQKALEDAGLMKNEKTIRIVQELIQNQMSVDKASILKLIQQSYTYKNASLQTLVLMNQYGLEMNDTTTTQFEAYRNNEHELLQNSFALLNSVFSELEAEAPSSTTQIHLFLLELSTNPGLPSATGESMNELQYAALNQDHVSKEHEIFQQTAAKEIIDLPLTFNSSILGKTAIAEQNLWMEDLSNTSTLPESLDVKETPALHHPDITEQIQRNPLDDDNQFKQELFQQAENNPLNHSNFNSFHRSMEQQEALWNHLPESVQKTLIQDEFLNGAYQGNDLLNQIKEQLIGQTNSNLIPLLQSNEYQSLLKETIINQWTLSPKMLKNKKSIASFYHKLESDLKSFETLLQKKELFKNEMSFEQTGKEVKNLQDSIDFMKSLNQIFSYVQLPMKLSNQHMHSELYVFTNKKKIAEGTNRISVLLHLSMAHLGELDVHLELQKNHVTSNFYVGEDSFLLIEENMSYLIDSVQKKGYTFTYTVQKKEKEAEFMRNMLEEKNSALSTSGTRRYSFDIRA